MVIYLKDIKKGETTIECEIFNQESMRLGHLVFDFKEEKLKSVNYSIEFELSEKIIKHISDELIRLSCYVDIHKELRIAWN